MDLKKVFDEAFGDMPLICERHNVRGDKPNVPCPKCKEENEKDELTALRAQVSALQTEAKHWKDQHTNEVKRAKIIKDTGDVPLQRIQAYERMGELQGQVERLQAERDKLLNQNRKVWAILNGAGVGIYTEEEAAEQLLHYADVDARIDGIAEEFQQVVTERDQLRAEVERLKEELSAAVQIINTATEDLGFPTRQQMRIRTAAAEYQAEEAKADLSTSYEKGAESMRERAAKAAEDRYKKPPLVCEETCYEVAEAIRALPLKENGG